MFLSRFNNRFLSIHITSSIPHQYHFYSSILFSHVIKCHQKVPALVWLLHSHCSITQCMNLIYIYIIVYQNWRRQTNRRFLAVSNIWLVNCISTCSIHARWWFHLLVVVYGWRCVECNVMGWVMINAIV